MQNAHKRMYPDDGGLKEQVRSFDETPNILREIVRDINERAKLRKTTQSPPSFHSGGKLDVGSHTRTPLPTAWGPAIHGSGEHVVSRGTASTCKQVTIPIMCDKSRMREIVEPIIKDHIKAFLTKHIWQMCDGKLPFMIAPQPQRLVIIESPFGHPTKVGMEENAAYGRRCMADSLKRGEAPYASHLLYTQCLDDLDVAERKQGMEAGFAWGRVAQHVAVYTDRGVSKGMLEGIKRHQANGKTIEFRSIEQ